MTDHAQNSHPRLHQEAHDYAQRNRGDSEKWFDYTGSYDNPKPKERIITEEAKKNAETNKGSMKDIMGGYADPPIQRQLHPRGVRSEGMVTAEANKGGAMKDLLDNNGQAGDAEMPAPKLKGEEAHENAEKNNGVVDNLINNYGNLEMSDRPAPRVGHGGDEIAKRHEDTSGMSSIMRMEAAPSPKETKVSRLHQESDKCWDEIPPVRRTRPEAEEIIARQAGDSLNGIIHMDGDNAGTARWQVKTLAHTEQSKTPRVKTSPSRTRPEAMSNYQRSRGSEMGAILKMEPAANSAPRKVNKMFLKSEEW